MYRIHADALPFAKKTRNGIISVDFRVWREGACMTASYSYTYTCDTFVLFCFHQHSKNLMFAFLAREISEI